MSDCENLHPDSREKAETDEIVYRASARPSVIESLAVLVVFLLVLLVNFDRHPGTPAKAEVVTALEESKNGLASAANCDGHSSLQDC